MVAVDSWQGAGRYEWGLRGWIASGLAGVSLDKSFSLPRDRLSFFSFALADLSLFG